MSRDHAVWLLELGIPVRLEGPEGDPVYAQKIPVSRTVLSGPEYRVLCKDGHRFVARDSLGYVQDTSITATALLDRYLRWGLTLTDDIPWSHIHRTE